jgi:hypothetical protein
MMKLRPLQDIALYDRTFDPGRACAREYLYGTHLLWFRQILAGIKDLRFL